jgi:2-polyprenyl-6-methoxyphenol hydroxylase-like FAD-dependent oxidoreductase
MDYDVVVAGAGPSGLMLAGELGLAGVRVLVVERLTAPDQTIKAGSVNTPSAQAFYRRGLLPALAEAQQRTLAQFREFLRQRQPDGPSARVPPKFAGHFAGIMLSADRFDPADPDFADQGPAGDIGGVMQEDVEAILADRAAALGVRLRRGVELTGFQADPDGVTVTITGDREESIRAGWLVGCDGGRSTVRKLAGFDFPGTDPEITGHQAVVDMVGAEGLRSAWNQTDTGIYVHGPLPGRILTVEFTGPPANRDAPVTAAELQASLRRVSGVDVTITKVHTATRFTDNARQATTYRMGRVLLAGDAAHVHSPFGGQGLNLGVGDAMNLGWKLAATVHGWAPDGLLDSYSAERRPIGAWVLDWTRAQVALMRPEPRARALRAVVRDLADTVTGTTYLVKKISGVWQRYPIPGDHPLIGGSAPDLVLGDGTRLGEHGHDGRAVLLDLTDHAPLRALAEGWRDRVTVVTAECADRPDLAALLIRPDGYVAWAADGTPELAGAEAALTTWLGAPAGRPADDPGTGGRAGHVPALHG